MKAIKLLFLFLAVSAVTLYSCSDSNAIENHTATTKSIALRTALNEIKKANNISGRSATENPFCFSFVYPITLSLSNGTNVSVTSFAGLVDLLTNESTNLYVDGIAFPFQVMMQGAVSTIHNDAEFVTLLINCGISTWNNSLQTTYCFDIVFPVSVTSPNGTYEIHTVEQFNAYLNVPANGQVQINYPVSVLYNGQVVVINNIYEFYQMIDNCDNCICSQQWEPVCIHTPNGVVQYGNFCYAQCAGYTQNDIVSCNPSTDCSITDLAITVGACNTDGTYSLTLNFNYANPGNTLFDVHNANGEIIGTYPLASLPFTISHYPNSNTAHDHLSVNVNDHPQCTATHEWAVPSCNVPTCESNCPTTFEPVCVQTTNGLVQFNNACLAQCAGFGPGDLVSCGVAPVNFGTQLGSCFHIVYPVQVEAGGQLVTIHSDSEALQYYFPATAPIPAFVYPLTLTFGNSSIVVNNQAQFVTLINNECN